MVILGSKIRIFEALESQKIFLAAQKYQKSIRNYIVDLRTRYKDHWKRKNENMAKKRFWGGVKKKIPISSI